MNITTLPMLNSVTGTKEEDEELFKTIKVVHSKDDVKQLNRMLKSGENQNRISSEKNKNENTFRGSYSKNISSGSKYGISRVTGKPRTSTSDGYKCSAKCRPNIALGHNDRDSDWIKNRENVDTEGYHKTYLKCESFEKSYEEVFSDSIKEYNERQTRKDRRITNYYKKILEDGRNGSMKKNAQVNTFRKPVYEFIFQIGKRDHRLDTETSIKILEKFSLKWMPEHYPNIKAIGIYLHADEFTIDPVTKKRLDGAVHIHFDFIPVAHCLTKDEMEEEKKWRKELEQNARKEAETKGESFSKEKFDDQDWEQLRVQRFGKALQKGMPLQSSMSGACAEMGFRTKGMRTAEIQMEEAVRTDLLDFVESYGIKVNREISEDKQEEVSIDEYKVREDNKKLLEQITKETKANKVLKAENQKKSEELTTREAKVENMEAEKLAVEKREKNAKALEEKVAPYVNRIDNLDENEASVKRREIATERKASSLSLRSTNLDEKEKQIKAEEIESLNRISEKQNELNSSIADFEKEKTYVYDVRKTNSINERINSSNAAKNEAYARQLKEQSDAMYKKEFQYRMLQSVCGHADEISVNLGKISEELKKDLMTPSLTRQEAIDKSANSFKQKCNQILLKFKDAIRGFKNFLEGKTSRDFRNLADDMDRNNTRTFEEYELKHMSGQLDWQIREREQQYNLKPIKKNVNEIERD